jgi:hypothetical protein
MREGLSINVRTNSYVSYVYSRGLSHNNNKKALPTGEEVMLYVYFNIKQFFFVFFLL